MEQGYKGYKGATTQTYKKLYGYKNLLAWQAADDLATYVHTLVLSFKPRYFELANQMLSSVISVKANIAEGYCRNSLGDYIRFSEVARGSLGELGSQIQDCERWKLIAGDELEQLLHLYSDTTWLLEKLIKSLRAKRQDGTWDRNLGVKEEAPTYMVNIANDDFLELRDDSL